MDGQDAIYGGDYIFTDNTRFMLVEFKYEIDDLGSEKKKPRRLTLCTSLKREEFYKKISLKCHYIAWSDLGKHQSRTVLFERYYLQICNQNIFGPMSDLSNTTPDISKSKNANALFDSFLDRDVGATYYEFKTYTNWVSGLSKSGGVTEMELILDDPSSNQLKLLEFSSIQQFKLWMEYHSKNEPT